MLIDSHHHLLHRQPKLFRCALHDADIGLMRNQPIHLGRFHPGKFQGFIGHFIQDRNG